MKKIIIVLFILTSFTLMASVPSYMDERSLWERTLIKVKLKKDIAKSFDYSKLRVYSKKKSHRRIQGRIKNKARDDFEWVTFKVMMGENFKQLNEVHRFTVNNFEKNDTYFLDSNVYLGKSRGKKIQIVYVDSSDRRKR